MAEQQCIVPLAWNAQAVVASYERVPGLRAVGEPAGGVTVTASKTVAVPVERLYETFVDASLREQWLPDRGGREQWLPDRGRRERTATQVGSLRRGGRCDSGARQRARVAVLKEFLEQMSASDNGSRRQGTRTGAIR